MLSRSQRLSVEQFNVVMEKGRVTHSPLFLVRLVSGNSDTRIATVAPKKIAKTAVARNKMRRKLYEAVRAVKSAHAAGFVVGIHVIIFAKSGIEKVKQSEITNQLQHVFVKAGILR